MLQGTDCLQFWVLCEDNFDLWVVRVSKSIQLLLLPSFTAETALLSSLVPWRHIPEPCLFGQCVKPFTPKKAQIKPMPHVCLASIPFLSSSKTTVLILCTQRVHGQPQVPGMLSTGQLFPAHCSSSTPLAPKLPWLLQTQHSWLAHSVSLLHTWHAPRCFLFSHVTSLYLHCPWQVFLSPGPISVNFNPLTWSHVTKVLYSNFYKVTDLARQYSIHALVPC